MFPVFSLTSPSNMSRFSTLIGRPHNVTAAFLKRCGNVDLAMWNSTPIRRIVETWHPSKWTAGIGTRLPFRVAAVLRPSLSITPVTPVAAPGQLGWALTGWTPMVTSDSLDRVRLRYGRRKTNGLVPVRRPTSMSSFVNAKRRRCRSAERRQHQ